MLKGLQLVLKNRIMTFLEIVLPSYMVDSNPELTGIKICQENIQMMVDAMGIEAVVASLPNTESYLKDLDEIISIAEKHEESKAALLV